MVYSNKIKIVKFLEIIYKVKKSTFIASKTKQFLIELIYYFKLITYSCLIF